MTRLEAEKARRALRYFERTYRTEEASFLRFQRLPTHHRLHLRAWWAHRDDWTIFLRVCRFRGVAYKQALPRAERPEARKAAR